MGALTPCSTTADDVDGGRSADVTEECACVSLQNNHCHNDLRFRVSAGKKGDLDAGCTQVRVAFAGRCDSVVVAAAAGGGGATAAPLAAGEAGDVVRDMSAAALAVCASGEEEAGTRGGAAAAAVACMSGASADAASCFGADWRDGGGICGASGGVVAGRPSSSPEWRRACAGAARSGGGERTNGACGW